MKDFLLLDHETVNGVEEKLGEKGIVLFLYPYHKLFRMSPDESYDAVAGYVEHVESSTGRHAFKLDVFSEDGDFTSGLYIHTLRSMANEYPEIVNGADTLIIKTEQPIDGSLLVDIASWTALEFQNKTIIVHEESLDMGSLGKADRKSFKDLFKRNKK